MEVLGSVSSRYFTVVILLCGWHILCHQMPKYLIENAIKAYAVVSEKESERKDLKAAVCIKIGIRQVDTSCP